MWCNRENDSPSALWVLDWDSHVVKSRSMKEKQKCTQRYLTPMWEHPGKLGNPLKWKRRFTVTLSCRQKSYCWGWAVAEAPGKRSQQGRAPRAGLDGVFSEENLLRFWVTVLFPVRFGGPGGRCLPREVFLPLDISDLLLPMSAAAQNQHSHYGEQCGDSLKNWK